MWLHSLHISPYEQANRFNVDPVRPRRLLLNKAEIRRLVTKTEEKGLTLVPLEIYFKRGYAKVALAVARGRKLHDKREELKRRQQDREARRAMERALETDPNNALTHWAAANLYVRLGDLESAGRELATVPDLDVTFLTQVLDLVWRFYEDPDRILTTHVPDR